MSDPNALPGTGYDPGEMIRPLSVRMTESARAQLEILADLNARSVTEETRLARGVRGSAVAYVPTQDTE